MSRDRFEQGVLALWVGSRVPLTRVNLQVRFALSRKKLDRWLDELVREGVLEVDSDDAGEMLWTVPGAGRPAEGLTQLDELERLERLRAALPSAPAALVRRAPAAALVPAGDDRKSVMASGALSFFLGPVGWLYAAPLKDVLPVAAVYLVAGMLLPGFLLKSLLAIGAPLSALAGAFYAWQHNLRGKRTSVLELRRP